MFDKDIFFDKSSLKVQNAFARMFIRDKKHRVQWKYVRKPRQCPYVLECTYRQRHHVHILKAQNSFTWISQSHVQFDEESSKA